MWPFLVHAQQAERMRRVGVILPAAADDAEYQSCLGAFLQALAQPDWTIGRNLRADIHWAIPRTSANRRRNWLSRAGL